ncbi:MAG TPA: hypothetical protein VGJ17_09765, partial [Candidatus Limnocylindrales bacterium]
MSTRRRSVATLALLAAALALFAGCAGPNRATFPALGSTPAPVGAATGDTVEQVLGALASVGLQATVTLRPFRPAEGPLLAAAPRSVLQVA